MKQIRVKKRNGRLENFDVNKINKFVETFLDPYYGVESFAAYAGSQLDCQLEPRDFLNMDFKMASSYAHDQAERQVEVTVAEMVEENLPEEMEDEWNWKALVKWANTKQGGNYQEHQLKRLDRDQRPWGAHLCGSWASGDLQHGVGRVRARGGGRYRCRSTPFDRGCRACVCGPRHVTAQSCCHRGSVGRRSHRLVDSGVRNHVDACHCRVLRRLFSLCQSVAGSEESASGAFHGRTNLVFGRSLPVEFAEWSVE